MEHAEQRDAVVERLGTGLGEPRVEAEATLHHEPRPAGFDERAECLGRRDHDGLADGRAHLEHATQQALGQRNALIGRQHRAPGGSWRHAARDAAR